MLKDPSLKWLDWAREIQSLAQTGLHYAENDFDRSRYGRLMELAAEIVTNYSDLKFEPLMGEFLTQKGYATPKVDVRAAVFQDHKLLMVREQSDGCWSMPGGWADVGEIPSQGAEREAWEEAGFQVRASRLIGVYDANRDGTRPVELFHAVKLIYLCELLGGKATPSYETSDVGFFGEDEIPQLSEMRTSARHVTDAFTAQRSPERPTVYD